MTGFSRSARSAEREHGENQCTRDHRGLTIGRVITRGDYELAGAQFIASAYCALRPAGLLAQLSLDFVTRLPRNRSPGHATRQLPCLPTTTLGGLLAVDP